MNATYRLIFNRALGCLQVASELAKTGGGAAGGVVGAGVRGAPAVDKNQVPALGLLLRQILAVLQPAVPLLMVGAGVLAPGLTDAATAKYISSSISNLTITGSGTSQVRLIPGGTISGTLANQGTISGASAAVSQVSATGGIGTLSNTGTISGTKQGVLNGGSIGFLQNSGGLIQGGIVGVSNNSSTSQIGTLLNQGTISGKSFGVSNYGTISNLTNDGIISASNPSNSYSKAALLSNGGTIGLLSNSGTINGGSALAILTSSGLIGTFNNDGVITNTGSSAAVVEVGNTGTISNGGTIVGARTGLAINGQVSTVTNTGTISGVQVMFGGFASAINNSGLLGGPNSHTGIALITKSSLFNGSLAGVQSTLTNSGIIQGENYAISISSKPATVILDSGSEVIGTVNAGTTASTFLLSGAQSWGSGSPIIAPQSTLTITPSGDVTTADMWSVATVNNQGTLAVGVFATPTGGGISPASQTIAGNYAQSAGGVLQMAITPADSTAGTDYSQLVVTGTANLAGTLDVVPNGAASAYTVGANYDLIHAGSIVGSFGTVSGMQALANYVSPQMSYSATDATLKMAVAGTPTPAPAPAPAPAPGVTLSNAPAFHSGRAVAASTYAVNVGGDAIVSSLLDGAGQVQGSDGPRFTDSRIGSWVKGFGAFGRANGASVENYGGIAGYGLAINQHLVLGAAFAGSGTGTNTDAQQVDTNSFGGFAYAIDTLGQLRLSATLGAGYLHQSSNRNIFNAQNQSIYETAVGATNGWYFGAGLQAQYLIPLGQNFLMPYGRIDYVHTYVNGFQENGANKLVNLNIAYGSLNTNVAAFSGGLRAGTDLSWGSMTLIPWVSVGGTGYAGTLKVAQVETIGLTSTTETGLVTPNGALDTGAGVTLRGHHTPWTVKLAYNGQFAGDVHLNQFELVANYAW